MMVWRIRCSLAWFNVGMTRKAMAAENSGKAKMQECVKRLYNLQDSEVKSRITSSPGQIGQQWVGVILGEGIGLVNLWPWWIFTISA